ncbi:hypothetical protein G6F42_016302 [Rhizopus arrhizus]|nr:hypothetical protein G6F42_016302 [Rhizopus arrhizus]
MSESPSVLLNPRSASPLNVFIRPASSQDTNSKQINLIIRSLSCRSLSKPSNIPAIQSFCRSLLRQAYDNSPDILCLQETYASSPDVREHLNMQLQASDSIWTAHCGLVVSLNNPNNLIQPIFISDDGRAIYCSVCHTTNLFPPLTIMNIIYAPASSSDNGYNFYTQLSGQPFF